jgi:hypothetical protein
LDSTREFCGQKRYSETMVAGAPNPKPALNTSDVLSRLSVTRGWLR